jgi:hypothetical protein
MDRARRRHWRSAAVRALQSHVQAFGGMLDNKGARACHHPPPAHALA